jgi:hypothetical protein
MTTTLEDQLRAYGGELERRSDDFDLRTESTGQVVDLATPEALRPGRRRRFLVGVSALAIGVGSVVGLSSTGQQAAAGPRFAEVAMTTPDTHYVLDYLPPGFEKQHVQASVRVSAGRMIVVGQVKDGKVARSIMANVTDLEIPRGMSTENVSGQTVRTMRHKLDGSEVVLFQLPAFDDCHVLFNGFRQSFEETLKDTEQYSCVNGSLSVRPSEGNELLYDGVGGQPTEPSMVAAKGKPYRYVSLFAARVSVPAPILESMTYDAQPGEWKLGNRSIHIWETGTAPGSYTDRSYGWQESPDITLNLSVDGEFSRAEVAKMIESVRRIEPSEWAALEQASSTQFPENPENPAVASDSSPEGEESGG